jgi:hypothetical protein
MHRLAYRNFGTHESLVTNQSVEAATAMAGIRWWEVRSPNSNPVLYQDSTYAPGIQDTIHRWMGSIAMDRAGNMALGYSASNGTTTYPSSWYTGRLASDPLNTMPQGEGSIINGTGSQTGSGRWGDYTSMNVDPVDDCTFWYVNQWVPTTSSVGWQLRIGSFKFNECGADPNIDVSPLSLSATQATNTSTQQTLTVANTGGGTLNWTIAEEPADLPQMAHPSGYAPRDPAVDDAAGVVGAAPESLAGGATWQRPEVVLYDNGPLVNSPGTGPGGADESLARAGRRLPRGRRLHDHRSRRLEHHQRHLLPVHGQRTDRAVAHRRRQLPNLGRPARSAHQLSGLWRHDDQPLVQHGLRQHVSPPGVAANRCHSPGLRNRSDRRYDPGSRHLLD